MYGHMPPTPERGIEVSLRGIDASAECPFCGERAFARSPPNGGLWYVGSSCSHCKGIYSTGRWDTGCIVFKGAMVQVTICYCGARMKSEEFTKHKKTAKVPSDHAITEETWVDRL